MGCERESGWQQRGCAQLILYVELPAAQCVPARELTNQATLLLDNSAQVAEDVVELVDAGLNLADLALALGDELLLELELVLRDLRGKRLRLRLHLLELDRVAFVADSTVTSSAPERVETGIAVGSTGMSR